MQDGRVLRWARPRSSTSGRAPASSPTSSAPTTWCPARCTERRGERAHRRAPPLGRVRGQSAAARRRPSAACSRSGRRTSASARRRRGATDGNVVSGARGARLVSRQHPALRRRDGVRARAQGRHPRPVAPRAAAGGPAGGGSSFPRLGDPGRRRDEPNARWIRARAPRWARGRADLGVPGLFLVYPLARIFYDAVTDEAGRFTAGELPRVLHRPLLPALAVELDGARAWPPCPTPRCSASRWPSCSCASTSAGREPVQLPHPDPDHLAAARGRARLHLHPRAGGHRQRAPDGRLRHAPAGQLPVRRSTGWCWWRRSTSSR